MSDLPPGVFEALTRIAEGRGGRTPTHAHPMCVCGRPYLPPCPTCGGPPNTPCQPLRDGDDFKFHGRQTRPGRAADCPVHRKAKP